MMHELITQHLWFMYLAVALISLAVGSLLNVVMYRLPILLESQWLSEYNELMHIEEKKTESINLFFPRSFCPSCKNMIKAWQNIPLFSYFFLGRRCHECKNPISLRYPLIELGTMLLSLYTSWHFGFTEQLPFALLFLWIIICLFFIDLDHQLLPDCLTLGLLWIGLIANTQALFTPLSEAVLSAVSAYMALWLFIKIFYWITGKIGMGNGDFKLFAAFGAWFGWKLLPLILLSSSIVGTLIGLIYLYKNNKSRDTTIPFGPFLCVAGLFALFWGKPILYSYLSMYL